MSIDDVVAFVGGLDGVLLLRPQPGDGTPEIAWGDVFCYYAPDGVVPATQPFATVVTKDYPDDAMSELDRPGAFRVNVAATRDLVDEHRRAGFGPSERDRVIVHPTYGGLGWLAVVEPGPRTDDELRALLRAAHTAARGRWDRRDAAR